MRYMHDKKKDFITTAGIGLAGMAVGAIIGSALSNKDNREKVKDAGEKFMRKMGEMKKNGVFDEVRQKAEEMKEEARKKYEEEKRKADEYAEKKSKEYDLK